MLSSIPGEAALRGNVNGLKSGETAPGFDVGFRGLARPKSTSPRKPSTLAPRGQNQSPKARRSGGHLVAEQVSEVVRGLPTSLSSTKSAPETHQAVKERLVEKQKELKVRTQQAIDNVESTTSAAHGTCEERTNEELRRLRVFLEEGDADMEEIFASVGRLGEDIRLYERSDVDAVLDRAMKLVGEQRRKVEHFALACRGLEEMRSAAVRGALHEFTYETQDTMPIRAEAQRIMDDRAMQMNELMQMNRAALADFSARLQTAGLERQKDAKRKWHTDVLLNWQRHSHKHAIAKVSDCIKSIDFINPSSMLDLFARLQEVQRELWSARSSRALGALSQGVGVKGTVGIPSKAIRQMQDELTNMNDKFQDQFDQIFAQFSVVMEEQGQAASKMLQDLAAQLHEFNAQQEWNGQDSVEAVLESEVKPLVAVSCSYIEKLTLKCTTELEKKDTAQSKATINLLNFVLKAADGLERFFSTAAEFESVEIDDVWDDLHNDYEEEKQEHQNTLHSIQREIEQSTSVEELDELAEKALAHLELMSEHHKAFYNSQTRILSGQPETVRNFFLHQQEVFMRVFGLRSLHGLSGWTELVPANYGSNIMPSASLARGSVPRESMFNDSMKTAPQGDQEAEQEGEEEPEEPPPMPQLENAIIWDGLFEVSSASDEDAAGAYLNYGPKKDPTKSPKKGSTPAPKTEADALPVWNRDAVASKPSPTFTHSIRPEFTIRFDKGSWGVFRGDTRLHAGPPQKNIWEVTAEKPPASAAPPTAGTGRSKSSRAAERRAAAFRGPQDMTAIRGDWETSDGSGSPSAEVCWRPLCTDELGPERWQIGTLFQDQTLDELVKNLLHPPEAEVEATEKDEQGSEQAGAENDDCVNEASGEGSETPTLASLADGSQCLLQLEYDAVQITQYTRGIVIGTMSALAAKHQQLWEQVEEKVRQRSADAESMLFDWWRRHVSLRGVVQVEWYAPRKATVERHKESFQKLLHDVATGVQGLEQRFGQLKTDFEEAKEKHQEQLHAITEEFQNTRYVAEFGKLERNADASKLELDGVWKRCVDSSLSIATSDIDGISGSVHHFLNRCFVPEEGYSRAEIRIYKKEIRDLNAQLETRAAEWREWHDELETEEVVNELSAPRIEFGKAVQAAVESLCEERGLGRKHGVVRRKMQQELQTLMGYTSTSLEHLHSLVIWCAHVGEPLPDTVSSTVQSRMGAALRTYTPGAEAAWPVALELRAMLTVIGLAVRLVGGYLSAWRQQHESTFAVDNTPKICFVREEVALRDAGAEDVIKIEEAFKQDVVIDLFGRIRNSEPLIIETKKVRDAVAVKYNGDIPEFMETCLAQTRQQEETHRMQLSLELQDLASSLRGELLCEVVGRAFRDLVERQRETLKSVCTAAEGDFNEALARTVARRRELDTTLGPELASPNMTAMLQELCDQEDGRHADAAAALRGVRCSLGDVFRGQARAFLRTLVSQFEAMVTLVDSLPLPMHFEKLTATDAAEAEVVNDDGASLKRRLRRQAAGWQPLDGSLPQRVWEGVPLEEMRVDTAIWPEAKEEEENPEPVVDPGEISPKKAKAKAAPTPAPKAAPPPAVSQKLQSYRSPLHKQLFKSRNESYDQYRKHFEDAMAERDSHWKERESQEEDLVRSWKINVRQLKKYGAGDSEDEEPARAGSKGATFF